jgi:polar amino acid transport system substrate-binding protein
MRQRLEPTMRRSPFLLACLFLALFTAAASAQPKPAPAKPVVRLATLDWEPYIGQKLPEQGYAAALVREAFKDQGWNVQIEFYPWARALHLAKTGELDGLMPEYFNSSRKNEFVYSFPFRGGPLVLYKRKGEAIAFNTDPAKDQDRALRALKDKRFGVVRGYLNTPVFDAAFYLNKEAASDDATNLRKLVYKRIDLAVIDQRVAEYLIRTQYPGYAGKLEPMLPALADNPLYIAFSLKSARHNAARAAFDRGLARMEKDGRAAALYRRYILSAGGR